MNKTAAVCLAPNTRCRASRRLPPIHLFVWLYIGAPNLEK